MKIANRKSYIVYRKPQSQNRSAILDQRFSITQRGFSLVEVVLGALVIVLVVFIILNIPPSINLIGRSKQESLVKDIIIKKIELLRSSDYNNLANGTTNIIDPRLSSLPNSSGQTTIEDCPVDVCTEGETAKKVTVKVTWNSSGDIRNIEVVTILTEGGIQ